jgi:hypothetical protein
MKIINFHKLTYCALILLFGTTNAQPEDEGRQYSEIQWDTFKEPSKLLKYTTDPKHAWWQYKRQEPESPSVSSIALPTKCQYVAKNTDKPCSDGCICGTQCTSIYIWNASRPEPKPQYHICTNWNLNHGYQLRAGFQEVGFQIVPNRTKCGWQRFEGVSAMRVGRGNIDVNGTLDQPWGDPLELAKIEQVMKQEYPFVEIIIICATLVGPVVMFFGLGAWCLWGGRERKVKYRKLEGHKSAF